MILPLPPDALSRPVLVALWLALGGAALATAQLTDLGAAVLDECDAPGDCLAFEFFGDALAVCDFDDDGFDDLAVGVPEETVGANDNAGSIHVFYGSSAGLTHAGEQVIDLEDLDLSGGADPGDQLGRALAGGDFDRDGICDLAIGAPGKSVGAAGNHAGAVVVLFGSSAGLALDGFRFLSQNHLPPGSSESAEESDDFGRALAALPNGGLAVGVPAEDFFLVTDTNAGLVQLFSSSAPGEPLDSVVDREQNDFTAACPDGNELDDFWGTSLAVGRFDGSASLVVAGELEGVGSLARAGRVTVIGSPVACFDQDSAGVVDVAEADDGFGRALATADFDDDGFADLAVGAPFEEYDDVGFDRAGAVHVLFGSSGGLTATGDLRFSPTDFPLGLESDEPDENFGDALASGDFDGDGHDDLAIGAPFEEVDGVEAAGSFHVLYGNATGFDADLNQTFHSNFPAGMPDSPNTDDRLGSALAAGDFDGNGTDDLAVGMPREHLGAQADAGAVTVVYGLERATGAFGTVQLTDGSVSLAESENFGVFLVTRTGGAVVAASVDHSRTGGSATPGVDFSYSGGTEAWGVGDLTVESFTVNLHEDTLDEPNETIVISLADPSAGTSLGSPSTVTITIVDNDVAGSISFAQPVFVALEDSGAVQLAVTRTGGAASGVTVQFATSNASATAGSDYAAAAGTLTFGAGESSKLVPVTLLDDGAAEGTEVFLVTLSNPGGGGTLGTFSVAQVVLVDDEIFLDGFEAGNTSAWDATAP